MSEPPPITPHVLLHNLIIQWIKFYNYLDLGFITPLIFHGPYGDIETRVLNQFGKAQIKTQTYLIQIDIVEPFSFRVWKQTLNIYHPPAIFSSNDYNNFYVRINASDLATHRLSQEKRFPLEIVIKLIDELEFLLVQTEFEISSQN